MSNEQITLTSISSASGDKITAMLVNAILNDDHGAAKMAQEVIRARGSLNNVPEYTAGVQQIASGLSVNLVRDSGKDTGIA